MRVVLHAVMWLFLLLAGCATSPTGRSQLMLFPDAQIARLGLTSFQEIKQKTPVLHDSATTSYVNCVVGALTAVVGTPKGSANWEVTVFKAPKTINAFALPGGRIGVYSGILKVAKSQAQLAAVIGHEIGHVMADHANERMSTAFAARTGLELAAIAAGGPNSQNSNQIMGLLGAGATVGIILPFSRIQESEADQLGLRYMAQAGFDPREAVQLWKNMMSSGGKATPELLSTHPSDSTRITNLEKLMPAAISLYQQARASGKHPSCHA